MDARSLVPSRRYLVPITAPACFVAVNPHDAPSLNTLTQSSPVMVHPVGVTSEVIVTGAPRRVTVTVYMTLVPFTMRFGTMSHEFRFSVCLVSESVPDNSPVVGQKLPLISL